MSHYAIQVHTHKGPKKGKGNALVALGKLIANIEAGGGGSLQCYKGNAENAATLLSRNPAVERVTVTHVSETSCGVWREGKKS